MCYVSYLVAWYPMFSLASFLRGNFLVADVIVRTIQGDSFRSFGYSWHRSLVEYVPVLRFGGFSGI